ncbi:hypothetical protein BpV2_164c [Bathycoccus sp. RCC1105 virus BpV2]|nr:hypothetical protein BpV2_164c [Bathycoccus sp. RCC1105 virus BpV2]
MTTLGSRLRIIQSLTFLPLGSVINRVPFIRFHVKVVVRALRNFPQPGCLAPIPGTSGTNAFNARSLDLYCS